MNTGDVYRTTVLLQVYGRVLRVFGMLTKNFRGPIEKLKISGNCINVGMDDFY